MMIKSKLGPIPFPAPVVKIYPKRGPLQQFRFAEATSFRCERCGRVKKSKLVVRYENDWSRLLCNACYGKILSERQ